jgi:hypothetical protein
VAAILCHIASRTLVLRRIARGGWFGRFSTAFLSMAVVGAIASYTQLMGILTRSSAWWVELALLPTGLVSIAALVWCLRHSPDSEGG